MDFEALDNDEETTTVMNEETYLGKLKECIEPHIKIDEDPTPQHERKLNAVLRKMIKTGKSMAPTPNDKDFILRRDKLAQFIRSSSSSNAQSPTKRPQGDQTS